MKTHFPTHLSALFALSFLAVSCEKKQSVGSLESHVKEDPKPVETPVAKEAEAPVPEPVQPPAQVEPEAPPAPKFPSGKIVFTLLDNEDPTPGLVRFKLGNGLGENIESARAWVILLDDHDKIVGQKAFWLSQKENTVLGEQQEREWTTLVDVRGVPKQTKFTFSTITTVSGKTIHPESVLMTGKPE